MKKTQHNSVKKRATYEKKRNYSARNPNKSGAIVSRKNGGVFFEYVGAFWDGEGYDFAAFYDYSAVSFDTFLNCLRDFLEQLEEIEAGNAQHFSYIFEDFYAPITTQISPKIIKMLHKNERRRSQDIKKSARLILSEIVSDIARDIEEEKEEKEESN